MLPEVDSVLDVVFSLAGDRDTDFGEATIYLVGRGPRKMALPSVLKCRARLGGKVK